MTCASSSNIALLGSKVVDLSFVDQEFSNGVFISTVRPSERRALITTNQTDDSKSEEMNMTNQIAC